MIYRDDSRDTARGRSKKGYKIGKPGKVELRASSQDRNSVNASSRPPAKGLACNDFGFIHDNVYKIPCCKC